jgi:glycosyltransferase involved in cell wall biosynthesis
MEAMAVGVPVIATNIAGTSELIDDGRTGIWFVRLMLGVWPTPSFE